MAAMGSLDTSPYKAGEKVDERPVVLITTVDIGNGKSDKIEIRKGDEPKDAALAFCNRHGLPTNIVGPLTQHILDNLRKASKTPSSATKPLMREDDTPTSAAVPPMHPSDSPMMSGSRQHSRIKEEEAEEEAPAAVGSAQGSSLPQKEQQQYHKQDVKPLSFSNPLDNNRLIEQLSAKLMPVDDSRHLTVTSDRASGNANGKHRRTNSAATGGRRISQSADPSPRTESTVFGRLYSNALDQRARHDARRKMQAVEELAGLAHRGSMSWISSEMMRERNHGVFDNYGEMLYAEGLEAAALRRSKAQAIREERSAKELEGATFAPEITALAKALWRGGSGELEAQPAWQRLSTSKRTKTLERIEDMRKAREHGELQECTFRPRINKNSSAMMSERSETLKNLNISAHEQLFQDAIRRQQKMEELAKWYPDDVTFQPQINRSSVANEYLRRSYDAVTKSPSKQGEGAQRSLFVVDRLYAKHEQTKAKMEEIRARYQGPNDPVTGKPLYKPEVGRGPRNMAASYGSPGGRNVPVHEHLYQVALELQSKRDALLEAEKKQAEVEASMNHSTATSQKLFKKLKLKRFSQIFDYLNEAEGDVIDLISLVRAPTDRMDNLDNEVREDVELAAELHAKALKVQLFPDSPAAGASSLPPAAPVNLEQFASLMEEALQLRRGPRAYLVPSPSGKNIPMHTFKPQINKRSREMAARLRPPQLALHELLHSNAEAMRSKLDALRRENEEAAMRDCTFAPKLNAKGKVVEGRALRASGVQAPSSRGNSAAPSPRLVGGGVPNAQQQMSEMEQFLAMEQALEEAMAGVSLADQELEDVATTPNTQRQQVLRASANPLLGAPQVSAVLRAQLGADVDPADLRATEELLLDLLTGSDASDPAADSEVVNKLHQLLAGDAMPMPVTSPPSAAPPAPPMPASAESGNRRASKADAAAAVNMYVVPAQSGGKHQGGISALKLQDLASELSRWDHTADPTMAAFKP